VALIGWAILVGASLVAGALVAVVLRLPERIAAVVTSFGGGLLVAAIAFELVPEADERAGVVVTDRLGGSVRFDQVTGGHAKRFAVVLLGGIGLALAGAAILGGTVLADTSDDFVGGAQALAAGAVLAVVSISVVPHAFADVLSGVATATVLGFIAGYLLS
jgi:ZIP family zinc transporter